MRFNVFKSGLGVKQMSFEYFESARCRGVGLGL